MRTLEEIQYCLQYGDTKGLERLLKKGVGKRAQKWLKEESIKYAFQKTNFEQTRCVEILLRHGAQVTLTDPHATPPLIAAVREGEYYSLPRTCTLVLEAGAKVNATDPKGGTALQEAVLRRHPELIDVLLNWKADPEQRVQYFDMRPRAKVKFLIVERTPLDYALETLVSASIEDSLHTEEVARVVRRLLACTRTRLVWQGDDFTEVEQVLLTNGLLEMLV